MPLNRRLTRPFPKLTGNDIFDVMILKAAIGTTKSCLSPTAVSATSCWWRAFKIRLKYRNGHLNPPIPYIQFITN